MFHKRDVIMKKSTLAIMSIVLCFSTIPEILVAQPEVEWQRTYGGEDEDRFRGIIQTPDDGFLLIGSETSFGRPEPDTWIVKTDRDGEVQWTREYNGEQIGLFSFVLKDEDGGYFLINGSTIIKIDEDGEILWTLDWQQSIVSIKQNTDGGYSIAGNHDGDFLLVKTDENWNNIWTCEFGGDELDYCYSHVQTNDGGFILVGQTESFEAMRRDALMVKIDAEGDVEWHQVYGDRWEDHFLDVIQTEDDGFTLVGFRGEGLPIWLLKTNRQGEIEWERGDINVQARTKCWILPSDNSGFTLIGAYQYPGLYRANSEGEKLWSLRLRDVELRGGTGDIRAVSTSDGGYALGFTDENDRDNLGLLKLSADPVIGAPIWRMIPDTSFAEDSSLNLDIALLYQHIEDWTDPDSTLIITAENGEHVSADIVEDVLVIEPEENWWGTDSLRLIVTDPDEHSASTFLRIDVLPMNDPPNPFTLLTPENGWLVNTRMIAFAWNQATQNEFEIDAVLYNLLFTVNEQHYEIPGIQNNFFILEDVEILLDSLRIVVEGDDIEITWSVMAYDDSSRTECGEPYVFIYPIQGIKDIDILQHPLTFSLCPAFPNPFNTKTQIRYSLAKSGYTNLTILNLSGQEVAVLINEYKQPGTFTTEFNAANLSSGVYLTRIKAVNEIRMVKLVCVK